MKKIFTYIKKHKLTWCFLLLAVTSSMYYAASVSTGFAEFYARYIYKYISLLFNNLTGLFSCSIAEIILILCIISFIVYFIVSVVKVLKSKAKRFKSAGRQLAVLLGAVSVILSLFITNCGINYYRLEFAQVSGLKLSESTEEQLTELCKILAEQVNELKKEVPVNAEGITVLNMSDVEISRLASEAFDALESKYPTLTAGYSIAKPVFLSEIMSRMNITGIYFPFTFEANVNTAIPEYSIPSTMCHELAHVRGYMREDEANFISYLACMESDSSVIKYSGSMLAFIHSTNRLYESSPELYMQVYNSLSDGVKADLIFNSGYWNQYKDTLTAKAASTANDTYLKANNQTDGTKSYGRMVDLLLAYIVKEGV